ncbi:MAG: 3-methyl-2-oxobutanoate hydroxymethyltransferase, partial [Chloroflexi bacterium]|nr:3-methyl-2-oxobutanoate hydroxymethyltransferase [Chloroflexota bacterium]
MRVTISEIKEFKQKKEKFVMLTAYDYSTARLVDEAGVPLILVGDSLGMVLLGYDSTIPVTMDEMIHHTKAVVRGAKHALVIGDMPFMTYHTSASDALRN